MANDPRNSLSRGAKVAGGTIVALGSAGLLRPELTHLAPGELLLVGTAVLVWAQGSLLAPAVFRTVHEQIDSFLWRREREKKAREAAETLQNLQALGPGELSADRPRTGSWSAKRPSASAGSPAGTTQTAPGPTRPRTPGSRARSSRLLTAF
jgi:hypothetical protein